MQIRPIRAGDNAAVAHLIRDSLAHFGLDVPGTAYFDPQLDDLATFYAQPQRGYFVLVNDADEVVGGCGFGEYCDDTAELQKLYIAPAAQGQGASRRLVACAEAGARVAGYRRIYLETHHVLTVACLLY
ncbi:GNAT family N-acetyltransferase [Lacticaseibacillus thailandensis]|nr:GNAT family N-acetyltransferase [Lacticaseibacillus thailandensis]